MSYHPSEHPDERRKFFRSAFQAPVQVAQFGHLHQARLLDLSLRGALVERIDDWVVQIGRPCLLRLDLGPDVVIAMETAVAHVDGRHVGLLCEKIDLDSMTHLRRLVELNAGDPALLERELNKLVGL